jgi:hypothetical protein
MLRGMGWPLLPRTALQATVEHGDLDMINP